MMYTFEMFCLAGIFAFVGSGIYWSILVPLFKRFLIHSSLFRPKTSRDAILYLQAYGMAWAEYHWREDLNKIAATKAKTVNPHVIRGIDAALADISRFEAATKNA